MARKFGVAESVLLASATASKTPKFKVECNKEEEEDFFSRFREYDEVVEFLTKLTSKHSGIASLVEIGTSFEKRKIYSVEIASKAALSTIPVILAIAGVHGREWTSIAALLFATQHLVETWDADAKVQLNIVPIVNPDGYVRTFSPGTHDKEKYYQGQIVVEDTIPNRYFRKNGNLVDLNRNFGANWGNDTKTKSLRLPNSDVFQGSKPFSEPETRALNAYAKRNLDALNAVIDFHCCIGAVLAPPVVSFASKQSIADNERVGQRLVEALSLGGKGVTKTVKNGDGLPGQYVWRAREAKDRGAGLSATWAFNDLVVDKTFIVELRGKFVAPCFEIKQLGREALLAMRALVKEVLRDPTTTLAAREHKRRLGSTAQTNAIAVPSPRALNKKHWFALTLVCFAVLLFLRFLQVSAAATSGGNYKQTMARRFV